MIYVKYCPECKKENKGNRAYCSFKCKEMSDKSNKAIKPAGDQIIVFLFNHNTDKHLGIIKKEKSVDQIFKAYSKRAIGKNLQFDLTLHDFQMNYQADCYYCGDKMKAVGFDRVDSSKGYTKINCVPCCFDCNSMKMARGQNDFIYKCMKIAHLSQNTH